MVNPNIYPLNKVISHVKIIARSYSDLYSDRIETSSVAVSYCFVNKTGYWSKTAQIKLFIKSFSINLLGWSRYKLKKIQVI